MSNSKKFAVAALAGLLTIGFSGVASANEHVEKTEKTTTVKTDVVEKHACAGKNSCKGKGGCKSGDNGCAGKNSCKGKGGCATDGSKPEHK